MEKLNLFEETCEIEIKPRNIAPNTPTFWAKYGVYVDGVEVGIAETTEELTLLEIKLQQRQNIAIRLKNEFAEITESSNTST